MVLDFSRIKQIVNRWIDDNLDHRMLLHEDDPCLPFLKQLNEPVFAMNVSPTAENIARLIFDFAREQGLPVTEVRLWETESCFATYSAKTT